MGTNLGRVADIHNAPLRDRRSGGEIPAEMAPPARESLLGGNLLRSPSTTSEMRGCAQSDNASIVVDLISSIDSSAVTLCTRTSPISA